MTAEHAAGVGGKVEALLDIVMSSVVVPGPLRIGRNEAIVLTSSEAMRPARALLAAGWVHNATAADTVLAAARRICCGENPAPHHAATADHSQRMAFAEELARAVRGS